MKKEDWVKAAIALLTIYGCVALVFAMVEFLVKTIVGVPVSAWFIFVGALVTTILLVFAVFLDGED